MKVRSLVQRLDDLMVDKLQANIQNEELKRVILC